jgi:oxygen-independent coproporphyrinogen-3 oxidase
MSKRQVMIPNPALPNPLERYEASRTARRLLLQAGFEAIGIDHFAKPSDSLAEAARSQALNRNFQGYTDDPCKTLIGFGASAISKFPQGYVQNAVATNAYQARIRDNRLAGHKGYVMAARDNVISEMIDQIMCQSSLDLRRLIQRYPEFTQEVRQIAKDLKESFPKAIDLLNGKLNFRPGMDILARIVAARTDMTIGADHRHSAAV